jgi:hypothetical protein
MGLLQTIGQSLVSGIAAKIEAAIAALLKPLISQFADTIKVVTHIYDYTLGIVDDGTKLFDSITNEIDQITHFKFVAQWKNRVISVPKVFDNIQQLIAIPGKIVEAIKNLIADIGTKFKGAGAAEAVEEVIPGVGQVIGVVTIISQVLVTIKDALAQLQTVVDAITTVRKDITNLDVLFLPNQNPRKNLELADGGSIKIRVGKLHSAT